MKGDLMIGARVISKWFEDLKRCAAKDDHERAKALMNQLPLPPMILGTFFIQGVSLLHLSLWMKSKVITAYMIEAGVDVNMKTYGIGPPIMIAVRLNCVDLVEMLLRAGARCDQPYFFIGPLHEAAGYGYVEIVKLLIDHKCNVNAVDKMRGETPLHHVLYCKSIENGYKVAKLLIEAGANVNATRGKTRCPILASAAVHRDTLDIVKLLLENGAKIDAFNKYRDNALCKAVIYGNLDVARLLLDSGANIYLRLFNGSTYLHHAFSGRYPEMVELLLVYGVSLEVEDSDDYEPLTFFIGKWALGVVNELYSRGGGNVDEIFEQLYPGMIDNMLKCIELLVDYGADIEHERYDPQDEENHTPLVASLYTHSRIVSFLLSKGVFVDFNEGKMHDVMRLPYKEESKIPLLFIRQRAMFDVRKRYDKGPVNFFYVTEIKMVRVLYRQCKDELKLMKVTNVCGDVSVFQVFAQKNVGPCILHKRFKERLQYVSQKFPIYCDLIMEKFEKRQRRQKLIQKAIPSLSRLLNWTPTSFPRIFNNILSNLKKSDLRRLALV